MRCFGRFRRRTRTTVPMGFSLVEVITAMALLAIVMTLLSTLAMSVGRRGRLNELTTKRNLVLSQQVNRFHVMPLVDVAELTSGTMQMLVGDFAFNRRLSITSPAAGRYTIKVVIEPVAGEFRPDSVTIDRTRMATGSPLCTNC
jgi:prepilin-type N-terminal cleavage/methylation domain-containing protein